MRQTTQGESASVLRGLPRFLETMWSLNWCPVLFNKTSFTLSHFTLFGQDRMASWFPIAKCQKQPWSLWGELKSDCGVVARCWSAAREQPCYVSCDDSNGSNTEKLKSAIVPFVLFKWQEKQFHTYHGTDAAVSFCNTSDPTVDQSNHWILWAGEWADDWQSVRTRWWTSY